MTDKERDRKHRLKFSAFIISLIILAASCMTSCGTREDGEVRFPGEFEPMSGVTVAWPLDLPVDLIKQMGENVEVHVIIDPNNTDDSEKDVQKALSEAGVSMEKIKIHNHEMVSPYLRDYGAFFVFRKGKPEIVNFDNSIEGMDEMPGETFGVAFAKELGLPSTTSTIHMDGGNLMSDGRGTAVSDLLVTRTNGRDVDRVRKELRRVMGIENYILTIDPQGGTIEHVDCWAKFLSPDKVLVARVPKEHPRYDQYEKIAGLFETTLCCWGYPYRVYRVDEPLTSGDPADPPTAPYTNSLILNKHVYLPLGDDDEFNAKAIDVYKKALPGYEIHGFKSDGSFLQWMNTDALHCRTHEIPDDNMVFVDHYNVLHDPVEFEDSYRIEARIIPYSGSGIKEAKVFHRTGKGDWAESEMQFDSEKDVYACELKGYKEGQTVEYYLYGMDEKGNEGTQPYCGGDDPHRFTIRDEQ